MKEPIILIGPMNTGKSTLGKLLSEKTGLPQYSLDDLRWKYYEEAGFGRDKVDEYQERNGFLDLFWHWKKYEAYTVERTFEDYHCGVFDFGAGHSVYDDPILFDRVSRCLDPFASVILILPSDNPDESVKILNNQGRKGEDWIPVLIEHFVRHPSNAKLAKFTVFTNEKTPEASRDEILDLLNI